MSAIAVAPEQRHTRAHPCRICGGHQDMPPGKGKRCAGFRSADGEYEHCSREEYAGKLGMDMRTTPPTAHHKMGGECRCGVTHGPAAWSPKPARRLNPVTTRFDFRDDSGKIVGTHVRTDYLDSSGKPYQKKRFTWERLNGRSSKEMPLYPLADHLNALPNAIRIICEGEKTACALKAAVKRARRTDIVALGTGTGAPAYPCDESLRTLLGYPVVLWPDNNEEGRQQMEGIAERLEAMGAPKPKWIHWKDAPAKGDAADFFAGGGAVEQMLQLVGERVADLSQNTSRMHERNERNELNAHQDQPFNSFLSFSSYHQSESSEGATDDFPTLDRAAFYGTAGDIVLAIEPHTEASPVALLAQLLVCVGNAAGRHVYYVQEADRHYANLYLCLVGDTAKARKGTSWGHVSRVMLQADPTWAAKHVIGGLSSGEGIIHALRNVPDADLPLGDEGELLRDKRLLAREGEFASVLAQKARDGNILSGVLRDGWDGGPLGNLTKNSPERATDTHLSVIGHITQAELVKHMAATDLLNGYANRFLFVATKRARLLAHGGDLDAVAKATEAPIGKLRSALEWARTPRQIAHDKDAYDLWEAEYECLATGHPGLFGAVTSRAEAQVTRLSLLYALLDRSPAVTTGHLQAALALWRYCETSARYIFGDLLGDPVADRILAALRATPEGLTRTEISELFDRNVPKARIAPALSELERAKFAYQVPGTPVPGEKGRPPERWMAYNIRKKRNKEEKEAS